MSSPSILPPSPSASSWRPPAAAPSVSAAPGGGVAPRPQAVSSSAPARHSAGGARGPRPLAARRSGRGSAHARRRRSGSGDLELGVLGSGGDAKAEQRGGEGAGGGGEPSFLLPHQIQAPASPPPSLPRAASPLLPPPSPPPRGFSGAARGLLPPPLPATAPRLRPVPTTTAPAVARASAWSTRQATRRAEPATALPSVPTQLHPPAPARRAEPRKPSKTVASMCAAAAVVASTSHVAGVDGDGHAPRRRSEPPPPRSCAASSSHPAAALDAVRAATSPLLAMAPRRRFEPPPPHAAADPRPAAAHCRLHHGPAPPPACVPPWPLAASPRRALRGAPGAARVGGRCGGAACVPPQCRAHRAGGARRGRRRGLASARPRWRHRSRPERAPAPWRAAVTMKTTPAVPRQGRILTCRLQQPILVTGATTGDRGAKGRREGSRRKRMREKGRREDDRWAQG